MKKHFFALSLAVFATLFYSCVADGAYTIALPESSEGYLVKQSSSSEEISSSSSTPNSSSSSDNAVSSSSDVVSSSSEPSLSSVSSSGGIACATWGNWVETTPATCEKEGLETRTCTSGNSNPETRPIDKLKWGEWEITTPATQTMLAKGERICPNGDIDREDLARCGTDALLYAPEEQFCQNGTVKDLCGTVTYTATHFCQSPGVLKLLCGSATYTATQFCQSSNVVKDFCGSATYTATQFCQSPNVVKNLCGTKTYNAMQFCQSPDVVKDLCGGTATYTAEQLCHGNVVIQLDKCGIGLYNSLTQFCYNSSKVGNLCGNNPQKLYDPDLYECKQNSNGIYLKGGIKDSRDSDKQYDAVLIGTQIWMAENLNYDVNGSKCGNVNTNTLSDANTTTCDTYGRLYDWTTAKTESICPSGWHIPSNEEWNKLMKFVNPNCKDNSSCTDAGTKLKSASHWSSGGITGTDVYGFAALPGGVGDNGSFGNVGYNGYWWSASEYSDARYAYYRYMNHNNVNTLLNAAGKSYLFSVRCVKN